MQASNRKTKRRPNTQEQKTEVSGNVLDLRSIVAQRDARRVQEEKKKVSEYQKTVTQKRKNPPSLKLRRTRKIQTIQQQSHQKKQKRKKTPRPQIPQKPETIHPPTKRTLIGSVVVFGLGLCLFLLPAFIGVTVSSVRTIEQRVTAQATTAFDQLRTAAQLTQQLQAAPAREAFIESQEAFILANSQLASVDFILPVAQYFPWRGKEIASGWHLLQAGYQLSLAGEQITKAMEEFNATDIQSVARNEDVGITRLLLIAHATVAPTQEHVASAVNHLNEVEIDAVPEEKRALAYQVQQTLPEVNRQLTDATEMIELLLAMLGNDTEKRYAVIFANNHELRAGMGFPGALAFVDVRNGVVTQIDIPGGGIYDISGQLTENVIAPTPLHLVNPQWSLQDSLWFPHFPASAQKFQWFLSKSAAPSVDGVIALTPSVIEDLLEITGPIDLQQKYGLVIDENNFYDEVQLLAEQKYDETKESKQVIADMTPILFNKLFSTGDDPEQLAQVIGVLTRALDEKNMVMYMNDEILQQSISKLDWGGELKESDRDYIAVIQDNIAGGKTNGVVEDTMRHHATIDEDGSIIDTVTLTLNHTGNPSDPLKGVKYTSFVRFYVPQGSELISAEGFDTPDSQLFLTPDEDAAIDEDLQRISGDVLVNELTQVYSNTEFGKQVFGGWMQVEPGTGKSVTIQYKLPFTIGHQETLDTVDHYSLFVQKQPGSFGTIVQTEVTLPENMHITQSYPAGFTGNREHLLLQDFFGALIIERS